jgi:hypothetical protein
MDLRLTGTQCQENFTRYTKLSQIGRQLGTITNFRRWGFYTTEGGSVALIPLLWDTVKYTELRTKNPL